MLRLQQVTNGEYVEMRSCGQIWGSTLASDGVIYIYKRHTFDRLVDFIVIMAINTTWITDKITLIWLPN